MDGRSAGCYGNARRWCLSSVMDNEEHHQAYVVAEVMRLRAWLVA